MLALRWRSPPQRLAPIFVANGFAAPSVRISAAAPVQARLIALSGLRQVIAGHGGQVPLRQTIIEQMLQSMA